MNYKKQINRAARRNKLSDSKTQQIVLTTSNIRREKTKGPCTNRFCHKKRHGDVWGEGVSLVTHLRKKDLKYNLLYFFPVHTLASSRRGKYKGILCAW